MPPQLKQLVVESPDAIGRDAYERVAAIVLQDLDLVKVVEHLYIYADPMVPIFVAAGRLRICRALSGSTTSRTSTSARR